MKINVTGTCVSNVFHSAVSTCSVKLLHVSAHTLAAGVLPEQDFDPVQRKAQVFCTDDE